MLYKKSGEKELSRELFRHPTSEYRAAPFWAWNCDLNKEELLRQIDILQEMGFGGFHMHTRSGMSTAYLSDDFMDLVKTCVDKAKENQMLAWLYDEDRWPSGFAGGLVTHDPKYRIRYLLLTTTPVEAKKTSGKQAGSEQKFAKRTGNNNRLLATYDVQLDDNGCLAHYRRLAEGQTPVGQIWYASIESPNPNPRYNGGTYVNTLDKASIERFLEVTHQRYKQVVGEEFGLTIPSIFCDEPQTTGKQVFKFPTDTGDIAMPFTDDFEETFRETYGVSLLDHLPEVFWELPDGQVSQIRYFYHDHVTERFAQAFSGTLGNWCKDNGIALTGHLMNEASLHKQTLFVGECMRSYRNFGLPGIDMLLSRREIHTAKQAQSAVHQQGAEGMMDELYGVTSWDFDLRSHKNQGDWQIALGVTARAPHLAWVSMEGEAKRDYPASINYQSPWYGEYAFVEDHFARVNTALTRGKPVVRVGVIHPIESFWLHWGPESQTAAIREQLDQNFDSVANWLLYSSIDFDYICESTLPGLCKEGGAPLQVGQMAYDAVIVPGCENLRASTLERLAAFQASGGTLIFMGDAPRYVNAQPSEEPEKLFRVSQHIPFTKNALLKALEPFRTVELRKTAGTLCNNMLYNLRQDGDTRWLFVAMGVDPGNVDVPVRNDVTVKVAGIYCAELYDTLTGEIRKITYRHENGWTVIPAKLYDHDSLLLHLTPGTQTYTEAPAEPAAWEALDVPNAVPYTLDEPNMLLLDMAQWSVDDEPLNPREEILRIDTAVRKRFGWTPWGGASDQPWYLPKKEPSHTLHLRYTFRSEVAYETPLLALENPQNVKIRFNGEPVDTTATGYYVDRSIQTVRLPAIRAGENVIQVDMPYGERTAAESMYLLGQFGVRAEGSTAVVTTLPDTLYFGSIVHQGLPFYSGKLTYHLQAHTPAGQIQIKTPQYRAGLLRVHVDAQSKPVVLAPYTVQFPVSAGTHTVDIDAYISRNNGFGPLHFCDDAISYQDPGSWRSTGDRWSYEYRLRPEGVLVAPILKTTE